MSSTVTWLLLRGLAREQRHWESFPPAFAEALGVKTLTLDLPGFGTEVARVSPGSIDAIADDVRARWLAQRGDGPWSIMAISLGGMVAMSWCARFPKDFERLVVVNTSAGDLSLPWERFRPGNWPRVFQSVVGPVLTRERNIISMTLNHAHHDREALAQKWAKVAESTPPRRLSFLRQLAAATRSSLPTEMPVPMLVLASRADRLVSVRCSEKIAAKLKAPIALHESAGHDLSNDAPEWLAAEVKRWVTASGGA